VLECPEAEVAEWVAVAVAVVWVGEAVARVVAVEWAVEEEGHEVEAEQVAALAVPGQWQVEVDRVAAAAVVVVAVAAVEQ